MTIEDRKCVECSSPNFYARSRCQTCYGRLRRRQRREGSFELLLTHGAPLERLRSRTQAGPNGCLLYAGTLTRMGYGLISVEGAQKLAHRAIYELVIGPIPEGLFIDHTCHNRDQSCMGGPACLHRRCVNVDHLEPVSGAENTRRGKSWAINGAKTHCPAGHPYDEQNTHVYDGRRYCRACNRQIPRRRRAAV